MVTRLSLWRVGTLVRCTLAILFLPYTSSEEHGEHLSHIVEVIRDFVYPVNPAHDEALLASKRGLECLTIVNRFGPLLGPSLTEIGWLSKLHWSIGQNATYATPFSH